MIDRPETAPSGEGDGGAPTDDELLERLPPATREDRAVLRAARERAADPDQLRRWYRSLPSPSAEDLARRPITEGEPFRLPE